MKLEPILPKIVHPDQNGFVQWRQGFHNIRRVLNIFFERWGLPDHSILSLNAEKAFDRVEWPCLFEVLQRFDIRANFLNWICLLYSNPQAEILTNDLLSNSFKLNRGRRQGCPPSPLLFALAIEPLAIAICNHVIVTGITIRDSERRLALYADDIILFCSTLEQTLPTLLDLLGSLGVFSGYKINKYVIMFLAEKERLNPSISTPFPVTKEGFTYVGVKIMPTVNKIIAANYNQLTEAVTQLINRWMKLPISFIGCIDILKMTIPPNYLCLYQSPHFPHHLISFSR